MKQTSKAMCPEFEKWKANVWLESGTKWNICTYNGQKYGDKQDYEGYCQDEPCFWIKCTANTESEQKNNILWFLLNFLKLKISWKNVQLFRLLWSWNINLFSKTSQSIHSVTCVRVWGMYIHVCTHTSWYLYSAILSAPQIF